jgi:hypothetical protein
MNEDFRKTVRKLDTAGLEAREERRAAIRKEEAAQTPQQIAVDAVAAYRRGLRSYLDESYREINLKRLRSDPALAFFLLANRDPSSA